MWLVCTCVQDDNKHIERRLVAAVNIVVRSKTLLHFIKYRAIRFQRYALWASKTMLNSISNLEKHSMKHSIF